jgi:hypothetical protein
MIYQYDKNTWQYIANYEGIGEEEEACNSKPEEEILKDIIQTLIADSENPPPIEEYPEQFFTTLEIVEHKSATEIAAKLADRVFLHILTNANPSITPETTKGVTSPKTVIGLTTPKAPESARSYIATTRYIPDKFYGVVIDTGASQKSTAGYNQFLAYEKTYPTTINTIRAGQVNV